MGKTFDTNASEIVLPEGITHIDISDVRNLRSLRTLITPDSLEELDLSLFKWLSLKRLHVGAHTRFVSMSSLAPLGLEWLDISPENPYYETDGAALYDRTTKELLMFVVPAKQYRVRDDCPAIGEKAFYGFDMLEGVTLPEGLEQIGPFAFSGTGLTEFRAPKSLRRICRKAFYLCHNLQKVELNDGLESVESGAFVATALSKLDLPRSVREASTGIAENVQITISPDSENYYVDGCGGIYGKTPEGLVLREVVDRRVKRFEVHPETIIVGERAFRGHAAIEEVVLPDGLREIGDYAFAGCLRLRKARFPESLQRIGLGAFRETRLEEAYLPAGLDYLGFEALYTNGDEFRKRASSLKNVRVHPDCKRFYVQNDMLIELIDEAHTPDPPAWYVREGVAADDEKQSAERASETVRVVAYFGDNGIIDIPENVDAIGANAFSYARNVHEMRLHDGIKVIEPGEYIEMIPAHLHIEYREPRYGRNALDVYFPQRIWGDLPLTRDMLCCVLDPALLMQRVDAVIPMSNSTYELTRLMLWRLCDPFLLNPSVAATFRGRLQSTIDSICVAFARKGWMPGFTQLIEAGVLDASNIKHAIETVGARGTLEAASYLLELKRVYYDSGAGIDYSL